MCGGRLKTRQLQGVCARQMVKNHCSRTYSSERVVFEFGGHDKICLRAFHAFNSVFILDQKT